MMNWKRLMWANDFPHSDSTWPWSREMLAKRGTARRRAAPRDPCRDNVAECMPSTSATLAWRIVVAAAPARISSTSTTRRSSRACSAAKPSRWLSSDATRRAHLVGTSALDRADEVLDQPCVAAEVVERRARDLDALDVRTRRAVDLDPALVQHAAQLASAADTCSVRFSSLAVPFMVKVAATPFANSTAST